MGTHTRGAPRMARGGHQRSRVDGIDAFYQRKSQRTGLHHDAKKSCKAEASKKKSVKNMPPGGTILPVDITYVKYCWRTVLRILFSDGRITTT